MAATGRVFDRSYWHLKLDTQAVCGVPVSMSPYDNATFDMSDPGETGHTRDRNLNFLVHRSWLCGQCINHASQALSGVAA